MSLFTLGNSIPITINKNRKINNFAFDGCSYYFTIGCENIIIKTDTSLCIEHCFETCRDYDCICYDFKEKCFWASQKHCCSRIYKLDCYMNEVDCKDIRGCSDIAGVISGISYNCCNNSLIVSFPCGVIEINKTSNECKKIFINNKGYITSVLSLCPGIIITIIRDKETYFYIVDECGNIVKCYKMDCYCNIQGLVFNPCGNECTPPYIDFLILKKCCYPYLCKKKISDIMLGFEPCCCNYEICHKCCHCKQPDSCADIMQSIALIEASLSHILNAEGEKLQKVLATTDDIDKILCVNKEVNKTIVSVTHLEQVLYAKLDALSEKCGFNKDCHDKCNICNCENKN